MDASSNRNFLRRAVRILSVIALLALAFVFFDFAIDLRPPSVHSSYRFELSGLVTDEIRILRQDNLSILVIRRSADSIARLKRERDGLQDPDSADSKQPQYADNDLRSRHPQYFVSYAIGTDLGCALVADAGQLREVCGNARYDFVGRALAGARKFRNLPIPDYNFAGDFSSLTVRP